MYQSLETSALLQKSPCKPQESTKSTSLAVDFPAKMSVAPGLEKALKMKMVQLLALGFGESMQGSFTSLSQDGSWLKMSEGYCQQILLSTTGGHLELYSGTWPTWGTMLNGICTELTPYMPRTKESESLLWPTAVAADGAQGAIISPDDKFITTKNGMPRKINRNGTDGSVVLARLVQLWRTPQHHNGNQGPKSKEFYDECIRTGKSQITLVDQVKHESKLWPTPDCSDRRSAKSKQQGLSNKVKEVQNWPTSKARMGEDCPSERRRNTPPLASSVKMYPTPTSSDVAKWSYNTNHQSGRCLEALARTGKLNEHKGQLNADWVELLMGLPIGWTDIDKGNDELEPWQGWPGPLNAGQYPYEPLRVVEGQKHRAKRLKALGNGCVPQQIYPIFKAIMDIERERQNGTKTSD